MPVVAVVNGPAAGGGGSLAMACDIRIASETAQFTQAFAKIGVHADFGASFFLPRLVGEAKARELMFTGETIDAREAFRIGLVNRVVPPGQLASATQALAETFLSRAPLSLKLMKQTFSENIREEFQKALDREMEAQLQCFQSEDFLAGIEAFVQKKAASFEGK
jgi:enoyl-CoA hydratase/carnithine racemase